MLTLVLCAGGYMPIYKVVQHVLKSSKLERGGGRVYVFHLPKGKFTQDGANENEFCYKGWMYDVIHTSKVVGFKIYYCYQDHKETDLISQLRLLAQKLYGGQMNKCCSDFLKAYFSIIYLPAEKITFSTNVIWKINLPSYYYQLVMVESHYLPDISSPPWP
jgi:hypothetical protein